MKKEDIDRTPEYIEYLERRKSVRRQMIPAVVFFAAIALIILYSVVQHQREVDSGAVDSTTYAQEVDYLGACVGRTIYENTDEIDDSYGDYFYMGADYFEVRKDTEWGLFSYTGNLVFDGEDLVETFCFTASVDSITQEDVDAMAEELTTAFGDYTEDADGAYLWYADADGNLGSSTDIAWISCGLNADGILVIQGSAE
ncbi:MAG: hypothetical protein LUD14_02620 [Clostridiales bacterium]|nr:hypothetical protein [Clostridiales bacterium]